MIALAHCNDDDDGDGDDGDHRGDSFALTIRPTLGFGWAWAWGAGSRELRDGGAWKGRLCASPTGRATVPLHPTGGACFREGGAGARARARGGTLLRFSGF